MAGADWPEIHGTKTPKLFSLNKITRKESKFRVFPCSWDFKDRN